MFNVKQVALALTAALVAAGVVWACGPDFPNQLLDHRAETLKAAPQNGFAWEAQHLLVATDVLNAQEMPTSFGESPAPVTDAKLLGLTDAQLARVTVLRQSADGSKAYTDGTGLPEDLRLYTAGAVDYALARGACGKAADESASADADTPQHCNMADPDAMDRATTSFEKILALPPEQAALRSVWAAYMLGRIHALRASGVAGNAVVFNSERDAAAKAFQLTRARAIAGASDTQGLAVASFGEEARLYLYSGSQQCGWAKLTVDNDHCADGIAAADLKHAIALYAAEAGHGSDSAVESLAAIAGNLLSHVERAAAVIDGPVSQRVLVAYALARAGGEPASDARPGTPAAAADTRLSSLVQAIQRQGLDHVAGADRLASLAYRSGQYAFAATLAEHAQGPLASWVKAKLALQKGDLKAAAAAYADAARAFPAASDPKAAIEPANTGLIIGEQGVLALARGEYVEAMGHLYDAAKGVGGDGNVYDEDSAGYGYGNDASYVAERVLTVDELKAFIDAHAPASPMPAKSADKDHPDNHPLGDDLRWLLARRLMRLGRYNEAQDYFPASGDPRFGDVDLRAKAREYAQALHDAEHRWTDIGKAEARYAAAVIARENGMELLGYEQGPDYFDNGGGFQGGSGHAAEDLKQSLVTEDERHRFAASGADPHWRFHYRYIAADDAAAAADLLPPRSQAFAAVLCKAADWMRQGPPDYADNYQDYGSPKPAQPSEAERRVDAYYQRYVKQGAYVSWADNFGADCEKPDFDRARTLLRHQRIASAKHLVRHGWPYEIAGLVLGGFTAWFIRRRRRRLGR